METDPRVLLFSGRGVMGSLIRWQTWSQYSHAGILTRAGTVLESWQGKGIQEVRPSDWEGIDAYRVSGMTPEGWDAGIEWGRGKLGKKYDYWGVARFLVRSRPSKNDRWFCSEFAVEILKYGGVNILNAPPPKISPGKMVWSPLLEYDPDFEFPKFVEG